MEIKILDKRITLDMMRPQKDGDAGIDVHACIHGPIMLRGGETKLISLGFSLNMKLSSMMAILVPRSGSGNSGLVLGNLVGIVDSGYQGPVKACLWNRTGDYFEKPLVIRPMDRIAQLIFVPVLHPELELVEEFSNVTDRGDGGFGSTGQ